MFAKSQIYSVDSLWIFVEMVSTSTHVNDTETIT